MTSFPHIVRFFLAVVSIVLIIASIWFRKTDLGGVRDAWGFFPYQVQEGDEFATKGVKPGSIIAVPLDEEPDNDVCVRHNDIVESVNGYPVKDVEDCVTYATRFRAVPKVEWSKSFDGRRGARFRIVRLQVDMNSTGSMGSLPVLHLITGAAPLAGVGICLAIKRRKRQTTNGGQSTA